MSQELYAIDQANHRAQKRIDLALELDKKEAERDYARQVDFLTSVLMKIYAKHANFSVLSDKDIKDISDDAKKLADMNRNI